jgi:predicted PurR-regulated permease PerM/phosphoglycolate phosphatase-like HAD superfamily hydrolase
VTSSRWGHTTKLLVAAALLIVVGLLVYNLRAILASLVLASLLAYILAPLVGWLSRHLHIPRGLAVLLLYLVGLGLLSTAPVILIPTVVDEISNFVANLDTIVNGLVTWLEETKQITILGRSVPLPSIELPTFDLGRIVTLIQQAISPVAGGFFSVLRALGSVVASLVFIAIVAFYLMVDAERVKPTLVRLAPSSHREEATKLLEQINCTWNAFLRGQLLLSLSIGVLTWIGMSAVGIRFSIALGIIAGVFEIVPGIGPFLSAVPAVLLALFQGAGNLPLSNLGDALVVAGIYILVQQLENNLLVPRILGASLGLHPLAVLIGILAGATLWGLLGALLAAPLVATLRDVLRYVYRKMLDLEPFPTPPPFVAQVASRSVRAILFDLDGTLLSIGDGAVEQLAQRLGSIPLLSRLYDDERMARRVIARSRRPLNIAADLANVVGLDGRFPSWEEWLHRLYGGQEPPHYALVEGVQPFVRASSQAYDLGIVTRWDRRDTNEVIQRLGLRGYFKVIVTREDVRRRKPNAESIRRAAKALGHSPEQCIVVGDTPLDINAGKQVGALTVGVLSGLDPRSRLERARPDLILETVAELAQHLPQNGDGPDSE